MGRRSKAKAVVSASALSQMGVCERLVVFEYHEGKRLTLARKAAMQRGQRAHRRFASMGSVNRSRSDHCFSTRFASDLGETGVPMVGREEVLRTAHLVRRLILGCCRVALRVCRSTVRLAVLQHVAQAGLRALRRVAMRALGVSEVDRVD